MAIDLHPKEALITAANLADLPVAFLVGAPLAVDAAGGVPTVGPMLDLVRDEIRAKAKSELDRFESAISGKTGGEAYQVAMAWLQGNLTQHAVNQVIRNAVLQARKPGTAVSFDRDGDPADWHVPAGVRQLAQLACGQAERFPGPIVTTNFDPLVSLAIRDAGGRPKLRVIDSDGGLARDVETEPGVTEVVHPHGYWRGADTLHAPAQLTGKRPKLKASLQRLLQQRTILVAAYGGWDDVFAAALADLLNSDDAQLTLLWCFHENDPALVEARYGRLLERVAPAITRGRFGVYGGIDCHSIFADIGSWPTGSASGTAPTGTVSPRLPLAGWRLIDAAYLAGLPPLRPDEVLRYFDGAVPTWRHGVSDAIPRRQLVASLASRLDALRASEDACSLQLIRAAGGEGKSTLLLQVAAAAARSGDWAVLWRPSPHVALPPEHVAQLDSDKHWLVVADDAENLVRDLSDCARLLHETAHSNVHFLLAARDTDWRAAHGDRHGWGARLKVQPPVVLRGISSDDAKEVVRAWGGYGAAGLKQLFALPDPLSRANALVRAVENAKKQTGEGSFFGGLLAVRFGPDGLRAHVRELLTRLRSIEIEHSDRSLFDAFLYAAACHAVAIPGLNENVLADLVSVPRQWVHSRVVVPLGEEAAAVRGAGHVFTRQ